MQGAWVQSLVRELRFQVPCGGVAKKKKKKRGISKTDVYGLTVRGWDSSHIMYMGQWTPFLDGGLGIAIDKTQTIVRLYSDKILFHKTVADAVWLTGLSLLTPGGYLAVGGSYMGVCKNSLSHTLLF